MMDDLENDPLAQQVMRLMTDIVESVNHLAVGQLNDGVLLVRLPKQEGESITVKGINPTPKGSTEWKFLMRREKPDAVFYHFGGRIAPDRGLSFFLTAKDTGAVLQMVHIVNGRATGALALPDETWKDYQKKFWQASYLPLPEDILPYFPKKPKGSQ